MKAPSPDLDRAAIAATQTLIDHGISAAPVMPLPLLKRTPGVMAGSFADFAFNEGVDRQTILAHVGAHQDAITFVKEDAGRLRYLVAYNQRLPLYMLQRAVARELGHIVLGHDGSLPDAVRAEEALCFARHLLCPRALLHALQQEGVLLTAETFGNITGCYSRCLAGIRKTPGAHVPGELNRAILANFAGYVANFRDYYAIAPHDDEDTTPADLGTYMDNFSI